jgi:ATP-dependent helicase/DNAse subunit B
VVFVCGLQEGEFPLPGTGEPFLSDEQRRELAAASGLRLRRREDALDRERYLFYACVSRATERLTLSYRSSDEEGNLALRSAFISDVEDLLVDGWAGRRQQRLLADVVWDTDSAPTERERLKASAAGPSEAVAQVRLALSPAALELVRHRQVVSAGALESYADCPVKWLVEKELQPSRFEPEPDAIARGSHMHEALERLLRRLGASVTEDSLAEAERMLDDVLSELEPEVTIGRTQAVRTAMLRSIRADLLRYLREEAANGCAWRPEGLELRFGFEDDEASLPALELGEGAERVRVRGAIDRVDVDPDGRRAIVRDYKSGSVRREQQGARWREDRRLQVAIYMLVVRRLLGFEPVAGLYQPLGGRDLRARGVFLKGAPVGARLVDTDGRDEDELANELEDAAGRAIDLSTRLRAGDLTPCPETCTRNGCAYPGICRSQ